MSLIQTQKHNNTLYKILKFEDTFLLVIRDQVLFANHKLSEVKAELDRICQ